MWQTSVILAPAREEGGLETADREGGLAGTRGAQTLRWPTFYAAPRMPLDCGAFFRKSGTFALEVSRFFFATPQARESFV